MVCALLVALAGCATTVGGYREFRVVWLKPDGTVYLDEPKKTEWGSNETLIARLPIAQNEPSRIPGQWNVLLKYKDETLVTRSFTIDPATPEE